MDHFGRFAFCPFLSAERRQIRGNSLRSSYVAGYGPESGPGSPRDQASPRRPAAPAANCARKVFITILPVTQCSYGAVTGQARLRSFLAERSVVPAPGTLNPDSWLGDTAGEPAPAPGAGLAAGVPFAIGRHQYSAKTGTTARARDDGVVMRRIVTTSHPVRLQLTARACRTVVARVVNR